jgi:hypothetical protein
MRTGGFKILQQGVPTFRSSSSIKKRLNKKVGNPLVNCGYFEYPGFILTLSDHDKNTSQYLKQMREWLI